MISIKERIIQEIKNNKNFFLLFQGIDIENININKRRPFSCTRNFLINWNFYAKREKDLKIEDVFFIIYSPSSELKNYANRIKKCNEIFSSTQKPENQIFIKFYTFELFQEHFLPLLKLSC